MFGVVLWSDPTDCKAVFWCEDQGDLAYYESCGAEEDGFSFFDAGDMVQFDVSVERRMRRAHNPRLVQENACTGLPESLRKGAQQPPRKTGSAKIIAFTGRNQGRGAEEERTAIEA